MGDNHGNVESLSRVVDDTEGEEFDFIIHTDDITDAWRKDTATAAKQLADLRGMS